MYNTTKYYGDYIQSLKHVVCGVKRAYLTQNQQKSQKYSKNVYFSEHA